MAKIIIGKVLAGFEPVENPAWNTAYMRKKTVVRRSKRVKAINVCLKARSILGEKLPAQIAKEKPDVIVCIAGRKKALSQAMRQVLAACQANAQRYCQAAAGAMGLDVDECVQLLAGIKA